MRTFILVVFSTILTGISYSQKEDYHWCLGYNDESGVYTRPIGGIDFVFHLDSISLNYKKRPAAFDDCNASICDSDGNLLLYTNGIYVANGNDRKLINGTGLDQWSTGGNQSRQGALILPLPGTKQDSFIVIHNFFDIIFLNGMPFGAMFDIYSSYVNLQSHGIGEVYSKRNVIITDSIKWGLSCVRHANGRDWWMPMLRTQGDFGYMTLIDTEGAHVVDTFNYSPGWMFGSGQSQFTPDGSKFVQAFVSDIRDGYYFDISDFDRCTGTLSNHHQIRYLDTVYSCGLAISPNSRFAYVSSFDELHQYDLWANNIEASRVVVAREDGFETIPGFNRLWFRSMGLGPDGKIYISGPGTTQHLHVIHAPDSAGTDCRVELHGIALPAYTFSTMPNIPNHRLGPVDGSSCDTLEIDNLPLARFRHIGEKLTKQFIDLSSYEPTDWLWEFGDGFTSAERQPNHSYQESGIYNVCLTVSNTNGTDKTCRDVLVDTTLTVTADQGAMSNILFYPSPSSGEVNLRLPLNLYPCDLVMTTAEGQTIRTIPNIKGPEFTFQFGHLPPGIYMISIIHDDQVIWSDRWIKI